MSGEITPDKFPLAWYDRALDYVRSVDCKRLATRADLFLQRCHLPSLTP